MNIRPALKAAALTAGVLILLSGVGVAVASAPTITSDADAVSALSSAQAGIDAAQGRIDAVQKYLARPTATPPPTTTMPPKTTTPPSLDGVTAAAKLGWGAPIAAGSDEFNGAALDTAKWGQPDGCWPANDTVRGGRCAANNSVGNGYLRETGKANGTTGYVSSKYNQRYGRWEARMRVTTASPGKNFHPVLLTWPQSEQWPAGGEFDYLEVNSNATRAEAFIHHTDGGQDHYAGPALDLSQWHNYAVEWQPGHVRGFVDGVQYFDSTSPLSQPPGPHHATAQLDNFVGTSGMATVHMDVDFYRAYRP